VTDSVGMDPITGVAGSPGLDLLAAICAWWSLLALFVWRRHVVTRPVPRGAAPVLRGGAHSDARVPAAGPPLSRPRLTS
jgi:hypothetical protein